MDLFLSVVFFFYPDRSQQVLLILLWKHKPALLFIALLCGFSVSQVLPRHCRAVQSSADIPRTSISTCMRLQVLLWSRKEELSTEKTVSTVSYNKDAFQRVLYWRL